MLYQASRNNKGFFWDEWIIPHSVGVLSLLECQFSRGGSSGFVCRLLRLRLSNRGLVPRVLAHRTHFTSWRAHTGYGLLQIITNSIFIQNLIVFLPFYFLRYFSIYLYCSCVHLTEKNIFPLIILWAEKISFSYLNFILLNGIIPFPFSFPQRSLYCNSLLLILISPQVFWLLYSDTTIFNQTFSFL